MKTLEIAELTELSNIEFSSNLFDMQMTIKNFTKSIFTTLQDGSDFVEKKDAFECDMRSIMSILIEKECFSEHSFRQAGEVFFGICNLNSLKPEITDEEMALSPSPG